MMEIIRKTIEGRFTLYDVSSDKSSHRIVVDDDGAWTCTCKSAKFRGTCRHVLAIKMNREWLHLFPRLMEDQVKPTPVSEEVFCKMLEFPRYALHMKYKIRATVAFGRDVFVNGSKTQDFSFLTPTRDKLAGTVIDVARDPNDMTWKAWDVYFFKGQDYRGMSLSARLAKVESVVRTLRSPFLEEAPLELDIEVKKGIFRWSGGGIVLKDLGSFINSRPRNWVVVK